MIYNVASLLTSHEGESRLTEIDNGEIYTDKYHFTGITGPVRLLRTDRTILVSASVSATVSDFCSRCLAPAVLTIEAEFEEEYSPVNRDLVSERPSPVYAEFDPALVIDMRNMLDMTEALSQLLTLATPLAPLCKEDCAGLCPTCFVDRSVTPCNCDETPIDPRWKALAELTTRSSNSSE